MENKINWREKNEKHKQQRNGNTKEKETGMQTETIKAQEQEKDGECDYLHPRNILNFQQ